MTYLAVTNPGDRDKLVIRKLSLASALLAAGRGGIVAPLAYDAVWKVGFSGQDVKKGEEPKGTPASKNKTPRTGKLTADGRQYAYVVTSGKNGRDYTQINIDLNGNGKFGDPGEGPFRGADVVKLGKRKYSISLGERNGLGKADVRITTPCADQILGDIKGLYASMGGPAKDLAIVSMPDGIPQAIVYEGEGFVHDLCADFPFTNADDDLFGEVAVGRVTAENATFATLYASRVITYESLLDPTWQDKAGQARWENTYGELFENYGFVVAPQHDVDKLGWLVRPEGKKRGRRERGFKQDSPLASVAAIAHTAHSWWHDIGQTYDWDSQVLLAPVVLETGGCLSTALDRQADFHSVVSRMLRNGATAYVGNALPSTACQEQQRMMFWNEVLAGKTVGEAQLAASNGVVAVMQETGQKTGGPNHRMLYLCGLFGDPAFTMHVPSGPKYQPAHDTFDSATGVLSVYAPAKWWSVRIRVPEDWKKWRDKPLYVLRGPAPGRTATGSTARTTTSRRRSSGRRCTPGGKIKSIEQVQKPPKPIGWTGKYVVNENPDGSRTYMWRVRIADFNQQTGKIISQPDRLDYKVTFEPK